MARALEPPREIWIVSAERANALVGARPLAMKVDAQLLSERFIALVPFEHSSSIA